MVAKHGHVFIFFNFFLDFNDKLILTHIFLNAAVSYYGFYNFAEYSDSVKILTNKLFLMRRFTVLIRISAYYDANIISYNLHYIGTDMENKLSSVYEY